MHGFFTALAKAISVATALALCFLVAAAGQPDAAGRRGAAAVDLRWTFDREGLDALPGPEQDGASCGGEAEACDLSLRQLRGELRREAPQQLGPDEPEEGELGREAPQQLGPDEPGEGELRREAPQQLGPDEPEEGELRRGAPQQLEEEEEDDEEETEGRGSGPRLPDEGGGSMEGHVYRSSDEDYRRDAEAFLQKHAGKAACRLPRASMAEAERIRARVLDEYTQEGGRIKDEPTDSLPWTVRFLFAQAMFSAKPGLLKDVGTTWPATRLWANASALAARLGPRRMRLKKFFYGPDAPVPSDRLPAEEKDRPPPETMSEYLARNESGRNFIVFISETIETSDFNLALLEALKPDIEPLPFFAAPAYERQAIVALDGLGASAGWHHHAAVWQTQVTGRKAWWLMPPDVDELFKHGPPVIDGRVYDHRNACEQLIRQPPPPAAELCVLEPGETLILPKGWWHATCGLDDITASAGGWMHE